MARDERAHRVRRLCALAEPVCEPLGVDSDHRWLRTWIVVTEDFDEAAVARRLGVGHDHTEKRTLLGTCPAQTNRQHLSLLHDPGARNLREPVSLHINLTAEPAELAECVLFSACSACSAAK